MGVFYRWLGEELSLYVRQLAWLNTKPDSKAKDAPTRLEGMQKGGISPLLPPNPAPYLLEWLFDIGPSVSTGMGEAMIGWRDIEAWQSINGVEVQPWEARTLRRLSRDFLNQQYEAKQPGCPAPYSLDEKQVRDRVADQFKAMVGAMRKG